METTDVLDTSVRAAMRGVLSALTPQMSVAAAARLFAERRISGAPVVDESGKAVGVVSERDLLRARPHVGGDGGGVDYYLWFHGDSEIPVQVCGAEPDQRGVVADVMTRRVVWVTPETTLRAAIEQMLAERIHRLLVLDGGRLVGLLSTTDVLRTLVPGASTTDEPSGI